MKNLESKAGVLVRGVPFNHVQSAKANGLGRGGLRLRDHFHFWDQCFVRYNNIGSNLVGGCALRSWLRVRVFFEAFERALA